MPLTDSFTYLQQHSTVSPQPEPDSRFKWLKSFVSRCVQHFIRGQNEFNVNVVRTFDDLQRQIASAEQRADVFARQHAAGAETSQALLRARDDADAAQHRFAAAVGHVQDLLAHHGGVIAQQLSRLGAIEEQIRRTTAVTDDLIERLGSSADVCAQHRSSAQESRDNLIALRHSIDVLARTVEQAQTASGAAARQHNDTARTIDLLNAKLNVSVGRQDSLARNVELVSAKLVSAIGRQDKLATKLDSAIGRQDLIAGNADQLAAKLDVSIGRQDSLARNVELVSAKLDSAIGRQDLIAGNADQLAAKLDVSVGRQDSLARNVELVSAKLDSAIGRQDTVAGNVDQLAAKLDSAIGRQDLIANDVEQTSAKLDAHIGIQDQIPGRIEQMDARTEGVERRQDDVVHSLETVSLQVAESVSRQDAIVADIGGVAKRVVKSEEGFRALHALADRLSMNIGLIKSAVDEAVAANPAAAKKAAATRSAVADAAASAAYDAFEDTQRGSEELVRQRMQLYVSRLAQRHDRRKARVLDLGCGRGEFLDVLKAVGVDAFGVDMNRAAVARAKAKHLAVLRADLFDVLRKARRSSLAAVTAFHVIEHLRHDQLTTLIALAVTRLVDGGLLIFETPNALNLTVAACDFYKDPTHVRPVHPALLSHMLSTAGLTGIETLFLNPFPETDRLVVAHASFSDVQAKNFAHLDRALFGCRDCAVIATKQGAS